jgi:hypothetical protein
VTRRALEPARAAVETTGNATANSATHSTTALVDDPIA